jgi:hypothetical protein
MRRAQETATPDFFEVPAPAPAVDGTQDWRADVSGIVSDMLADAAIAGKDRHTVAAQMSRLTGHEISKAMLDGYSSPARDTFNLPAPWAPVLEFCCDSYALGAWHAAKRGSKLLVGAEAINAEIGRLQRVSDEAARKVKELKALARVTP